MVVVVAVVAAVAESRVGIYLVYEAIASATISHLFGVLSFNLAVLVLVPRTRRFSDDRWYVVKVIALVIANDIDPQ